MLTKASVTETYRIVGDIKTDYLYENRSHTGADKVTLIPKETLTNLKYVTSSATYQINTGSSFRLKIETFHLFIPRRSQIFQ